MMHIAHETYFWWINIFINKKRVARSWFGCLEDRHYKAQESRVMRLQFCCAKVIFGRFLGCMYFWNIWYWSLSASVFCNHVWDGPNDLETKIDKLNMQIEESKGAFLPLSSYFHIHYMMSGVAACSFSLGLLTSLLECCVLTFCPTMSLTFLEQMAVSN